MRDIVVSLTRATLNPSNASLKEKEINEIVNLRSAQLTTSDREPIARSWQGVARSEAVIVTSRIALPCPSVDYCAKRVISNIAHGTPYDKMNRHCDLSTARAELINIKIANKRRKA